MAEGRSNVGIANELYLTTKAVEKHAAAIFGKLGLPAETEAYHRRVLAVIAYLRSRRYEG
jgi:DNA-binding NarL/FixJ family response regulator